MSVLSLNYHSFFCIFTKTESDGGSDILFKASENTTNGWVEGTNYEVISSSDYDYDPTEGTVRIKSPGDYFILSNIAVLGESGPTDAGYKVQGKKGVGGSFTTFGPATTIRSLMGINGTGVTNDAVTHLVVGENGFDDIFPVAGLRRALPQKFIRVQMDGSDEQAGIGTSLIILKANGHYATKMYDTDSNAQTDDDYDIYDTDEGGTLIGTSNGVIVDNDGKFTPSATRKFLVLSSVIGTTNASTNYRHRVKIGASNQETVDYEMHTAADPLQHNICYATEVADSTFIRINNSTESGASVSFVIKAGTACTLLDISNKGVDPAAFLSFSTTKATDTFSSSSGEKNFFDQDNYGSNTITKTDRLTATNITYAADGGTFTFSRSGVYLVALTLDIRMETSFNNPPGKNVRIKRTRDGSTTTAYTKVVGGFSISNPKTQMTTTLMSISAGDVITFTIEDLNGTLGDDGSSITFIKVDGALSPKRLKPQETVTKPTVSSDYTINSLDSEVLGNQHDDLVDRRVPLSTAQPGPRHLRGRLTAYDVTSGGKK